MRLLLLLGLVSSFAVGLFASDLTQTARAADIDPPATGSTPRITSQITHGMSLFGDLKYPADFKHFDYVNPSAPKGGTVLLSALGGFDTLNPFTLKGQPAAGSSLIYDSLMAPAADEASSEYGLLAETVEVPADWSWVIFNLRTEARWHDGTPVTPEDVIFSLNILKNEGRPFYRFYFANVVKAEKTGPHQVKFTFAEAGNRELPQIVGQLVILPEHYWRDRNFSKTTLDIPPGSGPYRIDRVDAGRSISITRVEDYWGRDLPVNRGRHNFATMRWDYYRDDTVALEAFKAHSFDFRMENTSKLWATAYDFPALSKGRVIKQQVRHYNSTGMQGFVFNLRRQKFADPRVRQALTLAFDFEWTNKNLFYGQYTRTGSYFSNSELAATGLPDDAELALLEPYRGLIPEEVFSQQYQPPQTDGSGNNRKNLRRAIKLLAEAGWVIRDGTLVPEAGGEPFTVEFLLVSPAFERVVAPLVKNLARLGIDANIRTVDSAQYANRTDNFDFDLVVGSIPQSLSPGNEQRDFWSSRAADQPGSRNLMGLKNPIVDDLVEKIIYAVDRAALITACRALDRVLLWGHYVIPNWHIRDYRIAYWNRFGRPETIPKYGLGFHDSWWVDPQLDAALSAPAP